MILIDQNKCIGCGLCVSDCVGYNLELREGKAAVRRDCIHCGHCVAICPQHAVSIPAYDMADIEEFDAAKARTDPEALLRTIKFRRSIRDYKPAKLTKEDLHMLLQAGRYTATAKNMQDCTFVVIQEELQELKARVWADIEEKQTKADGDREAMKPYFSFNRRRKSDPNDDFLFRNAPAVLLITSDWPLNAGLAAQNMETMAAAMDIGMLYNGYLCRLIDANDDLKAWLGIEGKSVRACMLMGYPNRRYARTAPRAEVKAILK